MSKAGTKAPQKSDYKQVQAPADRRDDRMKPKSLKGKGKGKGK